MAKTGPKTKVSVEALELQFLEAYAETGDATKAVYKVLGTEDVSKNLHQYRRILQLRRDPRILDRMRDIDDAILERAGWTQVRALETLITIAEGDDRKAALQAIAILEMKRTGYAIDKLEHGGKNPEAPTEAQKELRALVDARIERLKRETNSGGSVSDAVIVGES